MKFIITDWRIVFLILPFSLITTNSFAYFCPTNFNSISDGDTIAQVTAQCGKPDLQVTKEGEVNTPQEWNYYIPQTVSLGGTAQGQGTLKTSVTFDANGKAINISVNGIGVGASTICGKSIALGDTRDSIKSTCGDPSFINKQAPNASGALGTPAPPPKITTFTYNSNPPVVLTFVDGKLTGKQ